MLNSSMQFALLLCSLLPLSVNASPIPRTSSPSGFFGQWSVSRESYKTVKAATKEACLSSCLKERSKKCKVALFDQKKANKNCKFIDTVNGKPLDRPIKFSPGEVLCAARAPSFVPKDFSTECPQVELNGKRGQESIVQNVQGCLSMCQNSKSKSPCLRAMIRQTDRRGKLKCQLLTAGKAKVMYFPGEGACDPAKTADIETPPVDDGKPQVGAPLTPGCPREIGLKGKIGEPVEVSTDQECKETCTLPCTHVITTKVGDMMQCAPFNQGEGTTPLRLKQGETVCRVNSAENPVTAGCEKEQELKGKKQISSDVVTIQACKDKCTPPCSHVIMSLQKSKNMIKCTPFNENEGTVLLRPRADETVCRVNGGESQAQPKEDPVTDECPRENGLKGTREEPVEVSTEQECKESCFSPCTHVITSQVGDIVNCAAFYEGEGTTPLTLKGGEKVCRVNEAGASQEY